jgi:hypothetical protein
MAAAAKTNENNNSWLKSLTQWLKGFISDQRAEIASRAASPTLTGINLMPEDYTPAKLIDHPGVGSHEEIEPMK